MTTDIEHMDSLKELQDLLQEKFAIDPSMLDPHASMKERGGMDSLALVEFVFAVEDHFGITLSDEDSAVDTLTELAAVVDKARAAKAAA